MSAEDQKKIFSKNLQKYINESGKTQKEIAEELGFSISTFGSWCTGQKMPRMDKIQRLADYFGIKKSDLVEEYNPNSRTVEINMDDFQYAFYNASAKLSENDKKKILEYARLLKMQKQMNEEKEKNK